MQRYPFRKKQNRTSELGRGGAGPVLDDRSSSHPPGCRAPLRALGESRVPGNRLRSYRWVGRVEKVRLAGRVKSDHSRPPAKKWKRGYSCKGEAQGRDAIGRSI